MTGPLPRVREWTNADAALFKNEIVPRNEPAVLRGVAREWPAVRAGLDSANALASYIRTFDGGRPVETLMGDPAIKGRFFYEEGLKSLNFVRKQEQIGASLERILGLADEADPPSVFIQSASIPDSLPGFAEANALPLAHPSAVPRIWVGNSVTVATHYDLSDNIACVVGGRRRFTFFPPEQIQNLYVGPIHYTLAGQPVSMVSLDAPDLVRYPRFAEALAAAQVAELEPGDAVYIPYFWWHHVKSLERFNVLVNYWWNEAEPGFGSPYDGLLHAFLTLRTLPANQRAAWCAVFDHYVFETGGDPVAHLPPDSRGALGPMTPALAAQIKAGLLRRLNRS
jgi:hypothetical protein